MSDWTDDILLTAYALGEVDDPAERALVERMLAASPESRQAVEQIRADADTLVDGFIAAPDVGLTAMQIAAIERRLADIARADAPVPAPKPWYATARWPVWGSVAASTLVVATVMAGVLPRYLGTGAGFGPGNGSPSTTTKPAEGTDGGAGGTEAGVVRLPTGFAFPPTDAAANPPEAGPKEKDPAGGDGATAQAHRDWPMLQTSAGGLPWPAVAAAGTGLREPAFVLAGDFPLAVLPPTPAWPDVATDGTLAVVQSSVALGKLPPAGAIRTDALINSVKYDDVPATGQPVVAKVESAVCPWNSGHQLVRVTVRTCNATGGDKDAAAGDDDPVTVRPPAVAPLVRDLRLSVEVNPSAAAGYRVVGYENPPQSWGQWAGRDEQEVLAPGRTFTVLLEVVPAGEPVPGTKPAANRYRFMDPELTVSSELLTVAVAYRKGPAAEPATIELPVSLEAKAIELASLEFRAAAGAAALGTALRSADPAADPALEVAEKLLNDANATAPAADKQVLVDIAKLARGTAEKAKAGPSAP